jgi:hypothetical protein
MRASVLFGDAYSLSSRFGLPCAAEPERHVLFHSVQLALTCSMTGAVLW